MRTIDHSRYRVAEAIAEQWAAGDDAWQIGEPYFADPDPAWVVELIVAAHDRKGKFEPKPKPNHPAMRQRGEE